MKRFLILIFILNFISITVIGQIHNIFLDDSLYYKKYDSRIFSFDYDFNDSLPDGIWFLYKINKCDSSSMNKQNLLVTGSFKNGKKDGEFNYYRTGLIYYKKHIFQRNKFSNYIYLKRSFSEGLLNGYYIKRTTNFIHKECSYLNGKKNGIQIVYSLQKNNMLQTISLFKNDTLISWRVYFPDVYNRIYMVGERIGITDYKISRFNEEGSIEVEFFFKDDRLIRMITYYPNGVKNEDNSGIFDDFYTFNKEINKLDNEGWIDYPHNWNEKKIVLVKGNKICYSENGQIIETKNY